MRFCPVIGTLVVQLLWASSATTQPCPKSRGVQGAQHPLVKIWDTVYISGTITARKSKILQALRYCQMLFSGVKSFLLGACQGRSTPNVNLGSHHISETIKAGKLKFSTHLGRVIYSFRV